MGADEYSGPYQMGPVVMRLLPAYSTQYTGQPFQVQIQVDAARSRWTAPKPTWTSTRPCFR